jgi:hypothetical protein
MVEDAEENDFSDVVSWINGGRSFKVHKPMDFLDKIMPTYFNQTKYKSFQRQLNLYGFVRSHHGCHKGSYSHKHFRRDDPSLSTSLRLLRRKVAILGIAKETKAPGRSGGRGHSSSSSISSFDMQAIVAFEVDPLSSVCVRIADTSTLRVPALNEVPFCDFLPFNKDFLDTDDIVFANAGDVLNSISNDPLFQLMMNDAKLSLDLEGSKWVSALIGVEEVEEKEVGELESEQEHSFPWKLHGMLEAAEINGFSDIVSWEPDGVSFKVRKSDEFVTKIMPLYFDHTKYGSFRRQLNFYSFSRVTKGSSRGVYYHASFVKGNRSLCNEVKRQQ